jgi:uncharacterized SAM-binding protein YcdF (DUF218 family)
MAQIATVAGVPPGSISAEARSRDTIGNIWFTKPLLAGPGGQRVIVMTSDWHAARVRYLTDDLGTRLSGGCGTGDRRGEHAVARGDRSLGGGTAGGVTALVRRHPPR